MYKPHKDWLRHPETQRFLEALKDKARGIRYDAYLNLEIPDEDRIYLRVLEDMIRGAEIGPVKQDKETVEGVVRENGYDI